MDTTENIFKRNRALILFLIGLVIVFGLFYALRSAVFPFLFGLVLAYLLYPLILWVEAKLPYKDRWMAAKRISLIILSFIVILGLVAIFLFYLITSVADSFAILLINAPEYISEGLTTLREWFESLRQNLPLEIRQQADEYISNLGATLGTALQDIFAKGLSFVPSTFGMVLGFASLPIFLFYILKDTRKLSEGFYSFLSPRIALHASKIFSIIAVVLGRYIRAKLLLGLVVACLVFIGLSILGIPLAPALAVLAGVTDLIPILGPWIGGIVGVIVILALMPDKAIWAALVYLLVQGLENILLAPRIQGDYLHINPAILMVLLVLGSYLAGIWGMILFPPLTATVVEIYKYVRENIETKVSQ